MVLHVFSEIMKGPEDNPVIYFYIYFHFDIN